MATTTGRKLDLPLDSQTVDGLRKLGRDLLKSKSKREAFLTKRKETLAIYGLQNVNLSKLDKQVVMMLADPAFAEAVDKRDVQGVREHVQRTLGDRLTRGDLVGTFDFDFDFEVEVEVVAIAIAVFDFAVAKTQVPDIAELRKRRAIVAQAFESLGKRVGP